MIVSLGKLLVTYQHNQTELETTYAQERREAERIRAVLAELREEEWKDRPEEAVDREEAPTPILGGLFCMCDFCKFYRSSAEDRQTRELRRGVRWRLREARAAELRQGEERISDLEGRIWVISIKVSAVRDLIYKCEKETKK